MMKSPRRCLQESIDISFIHLRSTSQELNFNFKSNLRRKEIDFDICRLRGYACPSFGLTPYLLAIISRRSTLFAITASICEIDLPSALISERHNCFDLGLAAMAEEYSLVDTSKLLQAASDFSALQTKGDVPGLEDALIDCLEKVFRTKYGASLIPYFMPFIVVGLQAYSQRGRTLSCKTVSSLLENLEDPSGLATSLIKQNGVYPLLLNCLIDGDEQVAVAATDAIKNLACSQLGIEIIFPATPNEATDITNIAARCSSLVSYYYYHYYTSYIHIRACTGFGIDSEAIFYLKCSCIFKRVWIFSYLVSEVWTVDLNI
ncbi:hypothetical protein LXL04_007151 [Taraxacum kok-saghyz]